MPWKICLPLPPSNRMVCINIPFLVAKRKFPPDPEELVAAGVRENVLGQLKVLVAIEELAAELGPTAKRALTAATREIASSLAVPRGAELRFR
ncbi:MAG TPA: hypothetical protein VF698_11215 [Thermoanaerobaculia bacterium]